MRALLVVLPWGKSLRMAGMIVVPLLALVAVTAAGCKSQAAVCCECVVDRGCWDTDSCPLEPLQSCLYVDDDDDPPGYARDDPGRTCYSVDIDCRQSACASECKGVE